MLNQSMNQELATRTLIGQRRHDRVMRRVEKKRKRTTRQLIVMRKFCFLVVFLLPTLLSLGQTPHYEQVACEFFFAKVFVTEYQGVVDVRFSGHAEGSTNELVYAAGCLAKLVGQEDLPSEIPGPSKDRLGPIPISNKMIGTIKIRKTRAKSRLRLHVSNAVQINGFLYIGITIQRPHHFLDTYFLQVSQDGDVKQWCKYAMVI
jgi:hypothetical protein